MNVLQLSLWASPLIACIVILRALLVQRLPKKTFIALWGVAVLRLFLPFSIPSPISIGNIMRTGRETIAQTLPPVITESASAVAPKIITNTAPVVDISEAATVTTAAAPDIPLLLLLWLVGLTACALFFIITHIRGRRVYQTALPVENILVCRWITDHPLRRTVSIRQSDELDSPLTYGIWRPVILLPKDLDWRDESRLICILTHEHIHIRRLDALTKWLLAAVLCVHWFNPLVWFMYILANRDLELSCDETVLRTLGEDNKSSYARTLLSLEEQRNKLSPLCNNFSKNAIEERIVSIMKIKKLNLPSVIASFIIVICVTVVFSTSNESASAATSTEEIGMPVVISQNSSAIQPSFDLPTETSSSGKTATSVSSLPSTNDPSQESYMARMLFFSIGETELKVTYDAQTWEPHSSWPSDEPWYWWGFEEYQTYVDRILLEHLANPNVTQEMLNVETARYVQTLKDIKNGIRVSRSKQIFALNPGPQFGLTNYQGSTIYDGIILWYCFGYTFEDQAGNLVDLGIFETRGQLFAALKQYYDAEVAAGNLTKMEADGLYNAVAHSVRNADEVPLAEKLLNHNLYADYSLISY